MSLTSFLTDKNEKELKFQTIIKKIQPDKSEFKSLSGKAAFSDEFILKVPNNLSATIYSSIVGTTFDYLARFRVAQKIESDKKDTCCEEIIAENFFWTFPLDRQIRKRLKEKFNEGIDYVIRFINSNHSINKDLIYYSYFFGRLEQCWRSRRLIENIDELLDPPSKEIEDDLINLMSVFDDSFLNKVVKPDSNVIFNPSFGKCTSIVKGADADIFIDGVLYDFKTTKYKSYNSKDIQQIISYYLFNRVNLKMHDTSSNFVSPNFDCTNINTISIYLARYGEIIYLDMQSINNELIEKSINDILELFKSEFMSFRNNWFIKEYIEDKSTPKWTAYINEIKAQEEKSRLEKEKQERKLNKIQSLKFRQNEIVMITEGGTKFHTNKKCWALRNSKNIKEVTIRDAINQCKDEECELCY